MLHTSENQRGIDRSIRSLLDETSESGDLRFRALFTATQWALLPLAVRTRFSKRISHTTTVSYSGDVIECRISRLGRILANGARLMGAPLPLSNDTGVASTVIVSEDESTGGQIWTRIYNRRRGFPQVIQSSKRFTGPTGLEEYIGYGFGVALRVRASRQGIDFFSDHYFFEWGNRRLRLPSILSPGSLKITHLDCGETGFMFLLSLTHRWFGPLIHQAILFE